MALPGTRLITAYRDKQFTTIDPRFVVTTKNRVPVLLLVCSEARKIALKHYEVGFNWCKRPLYINNCQDYLRGKDHAVLQFVMLDSFFEDRQTRPKRKSAHLVFESFETNSDWSPLFEDAEDSHNAMPRPATKPRDHDLDNITD